MKKFISLLIIFILSACTSPQETEETDCCLPSTLEIPTQTLIPTPTLHPEFIALQELISSSGRYTLTPDGFIQENGVAIAGLQVDSNGIITLTANNEKIILTTSDITFAKGIKINGYELNDEGEWVVAVNEAEIAVAEVFGQSGLTFDSEKFDVIVIPGQGGEVDTVRVIDTETNKIIYENGDFYYQFVIEQIEALGLAGGQQFEPKWTVDGQLYGFNGGTPESDAYSNTLAKAFGNQHKSETGEDLWGADNARMMGVYLGDGYWGKVMGWKVDGRIVMEYLVFESSENHEVVGIPLISVGDTEIFRFIKSRHKQE